MDKGASFNIGVTQPISSNTNRIYDSDDDKWVENISNFARPTINEEESKYFQIEQGSTIILKIKCCKKNTQKGRKTAPPISRPSLSKYLVDGVYIPVNCDGLFHWVLAIVELK
ncbi:hypothetical protein H5410_045288 [Solanum commersonii]|uniref:Ubiquitin-like protease family profile domain-containing protein n=1 Tax=Solanum commersonii TaxID=4109 RepID=A0A9J5XC86_SOLCO|nr:hypothetical protein H5410_045288 [Solanum commersonii]